MVGALVRLLHGDDSVHVRATAAAALGGVGRRAAAAVGELGLGMACLDALLGCLEKPQENRVGQDLTQGVGPYDYKTTDESDLCEGVFPTP